MTKQQARKIARIYLGVIAQQDDSFWVDELAPDDNRKIQVEIEKVSNWLLKDDFDVGSEQASIVSHVLGQRTKVLAPDQP